MTIHGGLIVAIELAERKRDDAGQALACMLRRQDNATQQMAQLESYSADTQARWSAAAQVQTTPQIVGHYYQFMERLDQTITLQHGVIADVQQQCQAARQALLDAEVRLAGLQRVLARRLREQARSTERQEQRQTDEFAARVYSVTMGHAAYQDNP